MAEDRFGLGVMLFRHKDRFEEDDKLWQSAWQSAWLWLRKGRKLWSGSSGVELREGAKQTTAQHSIGQSENMDRWLAKQIA